MSVNEQERGIKYYDQNPNWGKELSSSDQTRILETPALFPEGVKSVLDVGCGDGRLTDQIPADLVVGLDFSAVGLTSVRSLKVLDRWIDFLSAIEGLNWLLARKCWNILMM